MKRVILFLTCFAIAPAAMAQSLSQSPAYSECTSLASSNPELALSKAEAWMRVDSSMSAVHCRAMALYSLRRYGEAGDALSTVRDSVAPENITLRSYLARQAARAWVNANTPDKASKVLSDQVTDISNTRGDNAGAAQITSDLLLDRARIAVTYGRYDDAAKDLDHAVSLTPANEDVLMERAAAFERLGDIPLARADAQVVLRLNSSNSKAKALLNRIGAGDGERVAAISAPITQPVAGSAATAAAASTAPKATAAKKPRKRKTTPAVAASCVPPKPVTGPACPADNQAATKAAPANAAPAGLAPVPAPAPARPVAQKPTASSSFISPANAEPPPSLPAMAPSSNGLPPLPDLPLPPVVK